jgi:hypothetical protein
MKKTFNSSMALLLAGTVSISAHAFSIAAPGTEGFPIFVNSTGPVTATYQGTSASYSNDLYLMLDSSGIPGNDGNPANDIFLFNNRASSEGETKDLGTFTSGMELMFRLHVNNTGNDFFTGLASNNGDGQLHARAQGNWLPDATLMSFEDLNGTPEFPRGFNDLSFSLSNTLVVPEPEIYAMLLAGLGIIGAVARRRKIIV